MKPERVAQLMTAPALTVRPSDSLNAAAHVMWDRDCGIVPVTEPADGGERLVGVVTDRDACMAAYTQGKPLGDISVASVMSPAVSVCHPDDPIATAVRTMGERQVHRLPVVDEAGLLRGILSLADVARGAARAPKLLGAEALARTLGAITAPRETARHVAA